MNIVAHWQFVVSVEECFSRLRQMERGEPNKRIQTYIVLRIIIQCACIDIMDHKVGCREGLPGWQAGIESATVSCCILISESQFVDVHTFLNDPALNSEGQVMILFLVENDIITKRQQCAESVIAAYAGTMIHDLQTDPEFFDRHIERDAGCSKWFCGNCHPLCTVVCVNSVFPVEHACHCRIQEHGRCIILRQVKVLCCHHFCRQEYRQQQE